MTITVRIPDSQEADLRTVLEAKGVTLSEFVRQAIAEWERRPDCALPEYLPTVLADLVKASRAAPATHNGATAHDRKVNGYLTMPIGDQRKAIE